MSIHHAEVIAGLAITAGAVLIEQRQGILVLLLLEQRLPLRGRGSRIRYRHRSLRLRIGSRLRWLICGQIGIPVPGLLPRNEKYDKDNRDNDRLGKPFRSEERHDLLRFLIWEQFRAEALT